MQIDKVPNIDPNIEINGYKIGKLLGMGAFSSVYKVEKENKNYAMKCTFSERFVEHDGIVGQLYEQELNALKDIKSKYVIQFFESFKQKINDKDIQCTIMEYCDCGTLYDLQQKQKGFNENTALDYFKQIVRGIYEFHKKKIVHRDLKLANILVHNHDQIKIADLGFCQKLQQKNQKMKLNLGTLGTKAPEIYQNKNYDIRCDMFSLGVILYQLLFNEFPFSIKSEDDYLTSIKNRNPPKMNQEIQVSQDVKDMIALMVKYNPEERLTYSQLFKFQKFQTNSAKVGMNQELEETIEFYTCKQTLRGSELQQVQFLQGEDQQEMSTNIINQQQKAQLKYQSIIYLTQILDQFYQKELMNPQIVYFPCFMLMKELYWEMVDFQQNHENNLEDSQKVEKINILNTSRQVLYQYLQILIGYLTYYNYQLSDSIREQRPEIYQLSKTKEFDYNLQQLMSRFVKIFSLHQAKKTQQADNEKYIQIVLVHIANYLEMVRQRNKEGQQFASLQKMEQNRKKIDETENLKLIVSEKLANLQKSAELLYKEQEAREQTLQQGKLVQK